MEEEIRRGTIALQQGRYLEARECFAQAENLGGQNSAEVNAGLAMAELQLGHFDTARRRETKVLALVTNDRERAQAHNLIGTAWLREAGNGADSKELRAAEESFRQAVRLDPAFDAAFFNLGNTLLRQNRPADAASAFRSFLDAAAAIPAYASNLPLTPQSRAPDFSLTDSQGSAVSLKSLRGRVVLLDFWATWCAPCIRALPVMQQLARYFPSDRFVLISINEDSDASVWRKFIAGQQMNWAQVRDTNAAVYHLFGLAPPPDLSIPRYILLDEDGSVRHVYNGTDPLGLVVGQTVRIARARAVQSPSAAR